MQAEPIDASARRGRGGRPRAKDAGDVERRILDAAASLFLRLGFDATSCEQVVAQAGAGKASLYARYANKEELFAAVVRDHLTRSVPPAPDVSLDHTLEVRLRAVGHAILSDGLPPDRVALLRVVLATAHRMPELARLTEQIGRDRSVERIANTIRGAASGNTEMNDRALLVARTFFDLVFVPTQMRALLGDDLNEVMHDADRRISGAIDLLSKGGLLNGWT